MKILIVGRLDGWMGVHLSQFSRAFGKLGHEAVLADYHAWDKRELSWRSLMHLGAGRIHRQTAGLIKLLRDVKPQMTLLIPANPVFDLDLIREAYKGPLLFYDMDGREWANYEHGYSWIRNIDLLLSVSRVMVRELAESGIANTHYLPHGVDTEYYRPLAVSPEEEARFGAPIAFVGRPSGRRVRFLESIADQGLALWGGRWARKPFMDNPKLSACIRGGENVVGEDVVKLYRSTTVVVNVVREQNSDPLSIMNLQVFAVPSTGTCLLTERVEEIDDAFEDGKEIVTFSTMEELKEKAARYSTDRGNASRIGEEGRRCTLAHHTLEMRAREILDVLGLK